MKQASVQGIALTFCCWFGLSFLNVEVQRSEVVVDEDEEKKTFGEREPSAFILDQVHPIRHVQTTIACTEYPHIQHRHVAANKK